MKIVFCTNQIVVSGGMERVLSQRVNYFVEKFGYDVTIITTYDNARFKNMRSFFKIDPRVKVIGLGMDYPGNLSSNFFIRQFQLMIRNRKGLRLLNKIIEKINPDFLISLGKTDSFICYKVNHSCKKILEHHLSKKNFTGNEKTEGFLEKIKYFYKNYRECSYIDKYDEFLVLTEEDKEYWGEEKVKVINNPLPFESKERSKCKNKKIISVGRLNEQKGFDILVDVWKKINEKHPDWTLEIYGEGDLRKELQNKINLLNLKKTFLLRGNEKNIQSKYLESSIYVMTSRYEGMPMVLLEAMSYGLPLVSFDCPCGPKDLIKNGENGFLCRFGNINEMVEKINYLIENEEKRIEMGKNSKELSYNYSEDKIMNQWKKFLESSLKK